MFSDFLYLLRKRGLRVSMTEWMALQEALDSFTKAGAKASFEETVKGEIKPGMLADFVVLGENPFEADSDKIKDIPILSTWLNGNCVYQQ